ncbi:MAG: protein-glutamate O-methyltransferase CheR [Bacteroidia bacterium]|nr:protein-glutamate O-methyltransferase CheR [Bacteroidia bacterium]GIV23805.1 MAG: chemotaxis protein R [Bacteroidia bacterium]
MFPETLPEIADSDLEQFFQIMLTQYGYDFRGYAPASLKRRLGTVLKRYGLADMRTLNQRLLTQPDYCERFINEITVSTTELFRDPSAWIALKTQALPLFLSMPQLRIWHAGASTGEEVLSMAILLTEMGLYDRAQLIATDIDKRSLNQAQKATYPLRNRALYEQNLKTVFPLSSLDKYAREEEGQLVFRQELLRNVLYLQHNLVSEGVFGLFEIVLCRNVLIYFTPELQDRVVMKLVDSLVPGGVLMIGTKESLFWCSAAKRLVAINESERLYRRRQ